MTGQPSFTVRKWYDRYTRSWVVQVIDHLGNQVGDADYVYSRAEAEALERQYAAVNAPIFTEA